MCLPQGLQRSDAGEARIDGEERAGCFAWFVFLVSRDCCVALPRYAMGCLRFMIVVFPDHTN